MSSINVADEPEAPATTAERRRVPRLRSLLSGTIVFDENGSTMDCTVRNISAYGAKVVLADTFRLPESFSLRVPHHDETHRARIIWRKVDSAGLELSDAHPTQHRENARLTPREAERMRRKALEAPQF